MIAIPTGVRIYLAMGPTDMRKGFDGLSMLAQEVLKQEQFSGHLFVFRGKRGDLVKVLYWEGQGFCLFAKRLEKGRLNVPIGALDGTPSIPVGRHIYVASKPSWDLIGQRWRGPPFRERS